MPVSAQTSRVSLGEAYRLIGCAALAIPMLAVKVLGSSNAAPAANLMTAATLAIAAALSAHAARRSLPALAPMRRWLAAGMATACAGLTVLAVDIWTGGGSRLHWIANALMLASLLFAGLGFCRLPRPPDTGRTRSRRTVDLVIAASSLLFFAWLLVLKPLVHLHGMALTDQLLQAACSLGDVAVAGLVIAVVRYARTDLQTPLTRAAVGMLLITVGQCAETREALLHLGPAFGWPAIVIQAGVIMVAYSAFAASAASTTAHRGWRFDGPMITAALTVGLGFPYVATGHRLGVLDVAPAAVMIIALLTRQRIYAQELREIADANERAAMCDDLTGLATRRAFLARIGEQLATPAAEPFAVALMDLDGFKEINDRFGHHIGDDVLVGFSGLLRFDGESVISARLGGDEFAVAVFSHDPLAGIRRITDHVADVHRIATHDQGELAIRCSAGIAVSAPGDTQASDVMRRADLAMYAAKTRLAAPTVVFEPQLQAAASRRHLLIAGLKGAAERGEFHLVFQPLHDLVTGELVAAEALLRWTHPTLGAVPPDEFIPLAEETGQIGVIGDWVIASAVTQVAEWQRRDRFLPRIFVNVSTQQFDDPDFVERVHGVLLACGIPPEQLTLEVTETQLAGLSLIDELQKLHHLGISLAIDDFGTGHSNLARLSRLSSQTLKIDREFITGLEGQTGRIVLEAVTALAETLDMVTVAEGIETTCQREIARECGISWGQGYLFARPMPADELEELLPYREPERRHRSDDVVTALR